MRKYLIIGGSIVCSLLALYVASWFALPPKIKPSPSISTLSPYESQITFHASRPLSASVKKDIRFIPETEIDISLGSSAAGPNTRLTILFRTPLRSDSDFSLTIPRRGWGRSAGDYQYQFKTTSLSLTDKQEGNYERELAENPIIEKLPYDDTHFRVEWSTTDDQNRYVLDVTIFAGYGETPDQAMQKYRPEAERWIKGTGQPEGSYVARYSVQQVVGE